MTHAQLTQWQAIKDKYPDVIILLRYTGDYLAVNEDADKVSALLQTEMRANERRQIRITWVTPLQLTEGLKKLIAAGNRVAIVDPLIS